jgi:flagellar basal body-associated protein FliL
MSSDSDTISGKKLKDEQKQTIETLLKNAKKIDEFYLTINLA